MHQIHEPCHPTDSEHWFVCNQQTDHPATACTFNIVCTLNVLLIVISISFYHQKKIHQLVCMKPTNPVN